MTAAPSEPADRFGIPEERIIAVIKAHHGVIRDGCCIPTRREVATLDTQRLEWILLGWWWESPTELIPNDQQVADVLAILRARPDAQSAEIQRIIAQAPPREGEE